MFGLVLAAQCSGPSGPTASPTPASRFSTGGIVEYAAPVAQPVSADCPAPCQPSLGSVAAGPDGNVWYVDVTQGLVERITPQGGIAGFTMPAPLVGGAQTIAAGPDRSLWVLARAAGTNEPDWILRVSTTGDVAQFGVGVSTGLDSIAAGPDGNLWFTEVFGDRIGRLTPSGTVTEYATPTPGSAPRGIVAGPGGDMWFTESGRDRPAIGRITMQGQISELPLTQGPSDVVPFDIVRGPDGNLWFTRTWGIAHISPSGEVVSVALPQGAEPRGLVAGPDGNIWFTDMGLNAIGRLGVSGVLRMYPLPRRASSPLGIAVGADGRIWFTESNNPRIASIGVKVPVALIDSRPLIFIDSSTRTLPIRNTGDAPLDIKAVRIAGVDSASFALRRDTCSGSSLAPDAGCQVEVAPTGGGAAGIESAQLQIADNATGSPQQISVVAQVPICRLPVTVESGGAGALPEGEFLDTKTGQLVYDPEGVFSGSSSAGVRTQTSPGLAGVSVGYYDAFARRWLPVTGSSAVSPDGARYAYFTLDPSTRDHLHVVDVASGSEKLLGLPSAAPWGVLAFTSQGIYVDQAYEGIGPGLWLMDPDTGAFRTVSTNLTVQAVDGTTAWVPVRNPADTSPEPPGIGGAYNEIEKRDLTSGATTPWFYLPGTDMYVVALIDGAPIIAARDASSTTYWIVSAASSGRQIDLPLTAESGGDVTGFAADPAGMWVGTTEGVYLWTARTGGVLMASDPATPAGTCG